MVYKRTEPPLILQRRKAWVLWKYEDREGKRTKVPYQPNGKRAAVDKPDTWVDYETAKTALDRGGFDGLGVVLGRLPGDPPPSLELVGIDLDWKGWSGEGIPPEAQKVLDRFATYAELSPSGKGAHILLMGKLDRGRRLPLSPTVEVEIYSQGRYFTYTGLALNSHEINAQQPQLEALIRELEGKQAKQGQARKAPSAPPPSERLRLSRAQLHRYLRKLFARDRDGRIRKLWKGKWQGLYPSQSQADQALANHLAFVCKGDPKLMDALFVESGLYREKWDKPHYSDGRTYGQGTIEEALKAYENYQNRKAKNGGGQRRTQNTSPNGKLNTSPNGKLEEDDSLFEAALSLLKLWKDPQKNLWATVSVNGHLEHWPLDDDRLKDWLSHELYRRYHQKVGPQTMNWLLGLLRNEARVRGPTYNVYTRVAFIRRKNGEMEVYLDLGRPDGKAVKVTRKGWWLVDPPVRFYRPPGMRPLPIPQRGNLRHLMALLAPWNFSPKEFALIIAWLLGVLGPGSYPILLLNGEQGTGKTTLTYILKNLLDPESYLRDLPLDTRTFFITAVNRFILAFDNVGKIPPQISNNLCQLATGGGIVHRKLYTDRQEVYLEGRRPIILNGIGDFARAPDLVDRAIVITLSPTSQRLDESLLRSRFEKLHPWALGALLDLLRLGLRNWNQTPTPQVRMADFARLAVAAEPGYAQPGTFLQAYAQAQREAEEATLEASPVYSRLLQLLESSPVVEGTAQEILDRLNELLGDEKPPPGWPRTPQGLGTILAKIGPALRKRGIIVEQLPRTRNGRRLRISKGEPPEPPPQDPQDPDGGPEGGPEGPASGRTAPPPEGPDSEGPGPEGSGPSTPPSNPPSSPSPSPGDSGPRPTGGGASSPPTSRTQEEREASQPPVQPQPQPQTEPTSRTNPPPQNPWAVMLGRLSPVVERLEAMGQRGPHLLEVVADGEVVVRTAFHGAYRATLEKTLIGLCRKPRPERGELWAVWPDGKRQLLLAANAQTGAEGEAA